MWTTWRAATQDALYGQEGFYARGERPAAHFRTSVHASPRYAGAVLPCSATRTPRSATRTGSTWWTSGPARVSC